MRATVTALMSAAAVLVGSTGCLGPEPFTAAQLYPQPFLAERRFQTAALDSGRIDDARIQILRLLDAQRSAPHLTLAARLEEDPEKALSLLDEAHRADPAFAWSRYALSFVILRDAVIDRYEDSAEHLQWLVDRGFGRIAELPAHPQLLLAENYHRLGRFREETEQLEWLIAAGSTDSVVHYNLAWVLCVKLSEPEEALEHLDEILNDDPHRLDVLMLKGRALWDLERFTAAARLFAGLADRHPNALLNLALLFDQHLDDKMRALQYYELYDAYDSENADEKGWTDRHFLVKKRIEELEKGSR